MAKVPAFKTRTKTKTEVAIEAALQADGGDRFRAGLRKWLPLIEDAYRQGEDPFRSHFGLSSVGRPCDRELWLKWRWAATKNIPARLIRLFNRGHLEEARFLALLEMIDVHIHATAGGQDRISMCGGHVGSALDGTIYNVPDCPGEWLLLEAKTHNTKSFCNLVAANNVRATKPEHYSQMQSCMKLRGIHKTLYMAVNKNDDDLYCEVIHYEPREGDHKTARAERLVFASEPPPRLREDPSDQECRTCDMLEVCHYGAPVLRNCRTCVHSVPDPGGTWGCGLHNRLLDKAAQKAACDDYEMIGGIGKP